VQDRDSEAIDFIKMMCAQFTEEETLIQLFTETSCITFLQEMLKRENIVEITLNLLLQISGSTEPVIRILVTGTFLE